MGHHQGVVQGWQDVAGTGGAMWHQGGSMMQEGTRHVLLRWDAAGALAVGLYTHANNKVVTVDVVCGAVTAALGVQGGPCELAMLLSTLGASGVLGAR